jgi:hypothetical protein
VPRRKSKAELPDDLVPHPRFGSKPIPSGNVVLAGEIDRGFYRRPQEVFFPESAIPADLSRQNYSVSPRKWYVDILKTCRDCRRPFLFFAKEQQYWYETLRYFIDSDCVRCVECRKLQQTLRQHHGRFSRLVNVKLLSDSELEELTDDAHALWVDGCLHNENTLRRINNLAQKRIAKRQSAMRLKRLVDGLKGDAGKKS